MTHGLPCKSSFSALSSNPSCWRFSGKSVSLELPAEQLFYSDENLKFKACLERDSFSVFALFPISPSGVWWKLSTKDRVFVPSSDLWNGFDMVKKFSYPWAHAAYNCKETLGRYHHPLLLKELIANYVANWAENGEDPSPKLFRALRTSVTRMPLWICDL